MKATAEFYSINNLVIPEAWKTKVTAKENTLFKIRVKHAPFLFIVIIAPYISFHSKRKGQKSLQVIQQFNIKIFFNLLKCNLNCRTYDSHKACKSYLFQKTEFVHANLKWAHQPCSNQKTTPYMNSPAPTFPHTQYGSFCSLGSIQIFGLNFPLKTYL